MDSVGVNTLIAACAGGEGWSFCKFVVEKHMRATKGLVEVANFCNCTASLVPPCH